MRVALISCSKKKANSVCAAQDMYAESQLFKKTLSFCRASQYDKILILSAKYGILELDQEIEPYELSLHSFDMDEREQWAQKCFDALNALNLTAADIDIYGGKIYVKPLQKFIHRLNDVLNGLGIGERLRFLSQKV